MMSRIPIYQMIFGQGNDGKPGLVFTTEQEEYSNQSVLFTIPIVDNFHHPLEFIDYLEHSKVIFPFQLGEKYYDLEGTINFPEITFAIPETEIKIIFEIDNDNFFGWHFFPFRRKPYQKMKYVGKQNNLIVKNEGFIVLQPVDLYEMDELYLKHKGIFVGLTPNFGNGENYNRQ
jgi:hypothetical protein